MFVETDRANSEACLECLSPVEPGCIHVLVFWPAHEAD